MVRIADSTVLKARINGYDPSLPQSSAKKYSSTDECKRDHPKHNVHSLLRLCRGSDGGIRLRFADEHRAGPEVWEAIMPSVTVYHIQFGLLKGDVTRPSSGQVFVK